MECNHHGTAVNGSGSSFLATVGDLSHGVGSLVLLLLALLVCGGWTVRTPLIPYSRSVVLSVSCSGMTAAWYELWRHTNFMNTLPRIESVPGVFQLLVSMAVDRTSKCILIMTVRYVQSSLCGCGELGLEHTPMSLIPRNVGSSIGLSS